MASAFGVDFGTTYTSMAYVAGGGKPENIPIEDYAELASPNRDLMRTSVLLDEANGQVPVEQLEVGQEARRNFGSKGRLLENFKPLLARRNERRLALTRRATKPGWRWDALAQAQFPIEQEYRVAVKYEDDIITHQEQSFTMADISVATEAIFSHLARKAQEYTGISTPDLLVVGVPAQVNLAFRHRLMETIVSSGWVPDASHIRLLPEPLAVALKYGLELNETQTILVFDFGGGTLDLTIADIIVDEGSVRVEPRLHRQHNAGGIDFDWLLLAGPVTEKAPGWMDKANIDNVHDILKETRGPTLLALVEEAKQRLSSQEEASLFFEFYGIDMTVTRSEFEAAIAPHLERAAAMIDDIMAQAGVKNNELDHILMAGGTSSIPAVQQILIQHFGDRVRNEYVGSGTATEGFALAAQRPELIRPIVESTYSIWNPATARLHTLVESGTDLASVSGPQAVAVEIEYTGQPDVLIFEGRGDIDSGDDSGGAMPIGRVTLPAAQTEDVEKVKLLFAPGPVEPHLALSINGQRRELDFEPWHDISESTVPVLLKGDIVQYGDNQFPQYQQSGLGVIEDIRRIDTGEPAELAVGDISDYILTVKNPEGGSIVRVQTSSNGALKTATLRPKQGQAYEINHLGQLEYITLPLVTDPYSVKA